MHKLVAIFVSLSMIIAPLQGLATQAFEPPQPAIVEETIEMPEQLADIQATEVSEESAYPQYPVEIAPANEPGEWVLVWSDEFEGGEGPGFHNGLDLSVWEIQTGNGATMGLTGWGNGEIQYYHGDNVWVEDGMLHIEARLESRGSAAEGFWRHTSGRIRSVGTAGYRDAFGHGMSVRYGRIEASISLPLGDGLWPAFWMMPTYDIYGTWAASGEIDIMEARGRQPHMTTSAIHYGGMWPHNTHSHASLDLRTLDPNLTINDFIQYAVEWEPGEMRFFVNDHLFWTVNEWHALVPGMENMGTTYMWPAPFDQYFHVLLNLAIGGWFDGGVEPDDSLFDETVLKRVEYVRVWEYTGEFPDRTPPVLLPEQVPPGAKEMIPPGGQIWDTNFTNVIRTAPLPGDTGFPTRDGWELFSGPFGGNISSYNVTDGTMHVGISAAGGPVYANQLMQRVSLVRGRHYRLSFDASAAAPRSLNARLSQGANPGWIAYTNFNPNLTTNTQSFSHYFTMTGETNLNARLEINMGGSAHDIWIGNIALVEVPYIPEGADVLKTPLPNGNMVWNGSFDQGRDGMIFWRRTEGDADMTVHHARRQLEVTNIPSEAAPEDVRISQGRIPFANDTFRLSFDAAGDRMLGFRVLSMDGNVLFYESEFELVGNFQRYTLDFTLQNVPHINRELQIQFLFGDSSEVLLDNVRIERLTTTDRDFTGVRMHPLDNGDFFAEMRSWEQANDSGGFAATTINDGVATIDVTALGINPWSVIMMNNGLQVHSGFIYAVEFDISGTVPRNIQLVVETPAFARRLQPMVPVTTTTTTHRFEFTAVNNEILDLKFLMGAMEGAALGSVNISNVSFYIVGAPLERIPTFIADSPNTVGNAVTLVYHHLSDPDFSDAGVNVLIDGNPAAFTHAAGEIVLAASNFTADRSYLVEISAPGYESIVLVQRMIDDGTIPDCIPTGVGGRLINGDFSCPLIDPTYGWWHPDGMAIFDAPWLPWVNATHSYLDGGGIAIDMAAVGYQTWHIQLNQTLPAPVFGDYELVFTARSSALRNITVEFGAGAMQRPQLIALTEEWQTFTIERPAVGHVRFLLGGGDLHGLYAGALSTVYFGEIILREVEDHLATAQAALQALINQANALNEADFTEETWAILQGVLPVAVDALENGDLDTVLAVTADLQAAIDGLERDREVGSNWLINGDFSDSMTGPEGGWWYEAQQSPLFTANWFPWFDASYRLPAEGGIAIDLVNGGYLSWHAFLGQDLATRLPDGDYELVFTARSTRPRDIFVDFALYPSPLQQQATISLTEEWQTFTINVHTAELVRFLLGYVGGGGHNHTVYIQNVILKEVIDGECEVVVDGQFVGADGSVWRICEDGMLEIDSGFINWTGALSPWNAHRALITQVEIGGPITAGISLRALFRELNGVTAIEGLTYFDTTATTTMYRMFFELSGVTELDVTSFDTRNVTSMALMFRDASSLVDLDVSGFETGNVTDMREMFRGTGIEQLDLSGFDTSNVTTMNHMFTALHTLRELTLGESFSFIGTPNLVPIRQTEGYTGLWQGDGVAFTSAQLMAQFDGETMAGTFAWQEWVEPDPEECAIVARGRFANGATVAGSEWRLCDDGTLVVDEGFINWTLVTSPWHAHRADITEIVFTGPVRAGTSLRSLFHDLFNLEDIVGLTYFDMRNVVNMGRMFRGASSLTELDLSNFDTRNVVDMGWMFFGASGLETLDVTGFDTSNVVDMGLMFRETSSLVELDVTNFETENVRDMREMFRGMSSLEALDLSSFDTSSVMNMNHMFVGMTLLSELILGELFEIVGNPGIPARLN